MMYLLWIALIAINWFKWGWGFGLITLFAGFIDIIIHFVKKSKQKKEGEQ